MESVTTVYGDTPLWARIALKLLKLAGRTIYLIATSCIRVYGGG
nr:hypothetical protein [Candidatus Freyarchaeota archaeon]